MVLNTNYINRILIIPNKYKIYITNNEITGFQLFLTGSGCGIISSDDDKIVICKTKDPMDYKIVSEWIDKNE